MCHILHQAILRLKIESELDMANSKIEAITKRIDMREPPRSVHPPPGLNNHRSTESTRGKKRVNGVDASGPRKLTGQGQSTGTKTKDEGGDRGISSSAVSFALSNLSTTRRLPHCIAPCFQLHQNFVFPQSFSRLAVNCIYLAINFLIYPIPHIAGS